MRTRRSGGQVYIEVYLEFDGRKPMADVRRSIDLLTADLEAKIEFITNLMLEDVSRFLSCDIMFD